MTSRSNDYGRAYEYVYLITLVEQISSMRPVKIEKNSSYFATKRSWDHLTESEKSIYRISALAGINTLFNFEPLILEGEDELELIIQPDNKGIEGDVRDILIIRQACMWEIGLSIKHNHFAVKHSRLSKNLDFGKKWYGVDCSQQYWQDVASVFDYLDKEQNNGTKWSEIVDKENSVYMPLLEAFKNELIRQNNLFNKDIPKLMVEYLLGRFDFYKIIGIDNRKTTQLQGYNLRGTLNRQGDYSKPNIRLPISALPTRIVSLEYKPNSKNTLELYLDEGWQFSFRIHNASTKVEPSLKFGIQIIGMPTTIISIECKWR